MSIVEAIRIVIDLADDTIFFYQDDVSQSEIDNYYRALTIIMDRCGVFYDKEQERLVEDNQ